MNPTRFSNRTHAARWLLAAFVSAACADDAAPGAGGGVSGGGGGGVGSGGRGDASDSPDANALDASADSAVPSDGGLLSSCALEPEQLTVNVDDRGSRYWDALQVADTIHLAYQVAVCESDPAAQAQRLDYLFFASTGAFPEPQKVVNFADNACFATRTPTLAVDAANKPVVYYTTTTSGATELYQQAIAGGAPTRLTLDADTISDAEEHVAVVPFGPTNLIAYVNAFSAPQRLPIGQIVTRRVGFGEQEIVSANLSLHVSSLALGSFNNDSAFGGVLAYVADVGDPATINAQILDKSGKPSGQPLVLSKKVGALSNVSLAMLQTTDDASQAGAIVYGVASDTRMGGTELRFRAIGLDGKLGDEVELTKGNRNAHGVSIAPLANGYILAFRVVDAGSSSILVKTLDKSGSAAALSERVLVPAEASGSPTKIFVTSDGRVSVVFSNTIGAGTSLRAVRATCDP